MAAVKMAGLEVTPSRPSFSTMPASSPEVIRPRRMLSYQMLCPYFCTSMSGLAMITPHVRCWVGLHRRATQAKRFSRWAHVSPTDRPDKVEVILRGLLSFASPRLRFVWAWAPWGHCLRDGCITTTSPRNKKVSILWNNLSILHVLTSPCPGDVNRAFQSRDREGAGRTARLPVGGATRSLTVAALNATTPTSARLKQSSLLWFFSQPCPVCPTILPPDDRVSHSERQPWPRDHPAG